MTKTPKKLNKFLIPLAVSGLMLVSTTSHATVAIVLDFDYTATQLVSFDAFGNDPLSPLGSSGFISQSYGDIPGLLDISYRYINALDQHVGSLRTWSIGYDELPYAAWNGSQSGGDRGQVELASVNGSPVTLNSFRLGSWSGISGREETVKVFELGNATPFFEFTGPIGVDNLSNLFNIHASSSNGFLIEWTDPWWTAISNISVSAVPVPASIWLFASAFAGLVGLRRRV